VEVCRGYGEDAVEGGSAGWTGPLAIGWAFLVALLLSDYAPRPRAVASACHPPAVLT
jgi:hypothetical protein